MEEEPELHIVTESPRRQLCNSLPQKPLEEESEMYENEKVQQIHTEEIHKTLKNENTPESAFKDLSKSEKPKDGCLECFSKSLEEDEHVKLESAVIKIQ